MKELAGEVRAAQEQGTEADDGNVQEEGDAQDTPYDDAVQLLLEEIEGLPMKELSELPEEMEEPEMKADIDMAQIDLSLVEEQLDLSRAV
ncbi:MAG: hypothetical protein K2O73_04350, partial [Lachnospiraceae bacterium]|nr:hypothetical protein [Lachnospiraceae bacterium]